MSAVATRSTFNPISGDDKLDPLRVLLWLAFNLAENRAGHASCPRVFAFAGDLDNYPGPLVAATASPCRALSNLFWLQLPAEQIKSALGPLRILDIGCGRGNYKDLLASSLGGFASYTGVDATARPEWREIMAEDPRARFVHADASALAPDLVDGANLIVSQSALEHVRDDLALFRSLATSLARRSEPVLQIHLVPGPKLWRQHLRHGYRGYTPRAIARIFDMFASSRCTVVVLGGNASNAVHYEWIKDTLRLHRRQKRFADAQKYTAACREGLQSDFASCNRDIFDAAFLALIVETRLGDGVVSNAIVRGNSARSSAGQ